jgi:predicted small lipoprotein YifL
MKKVLLMAALTAFLAACGQKADDGMKTPSVDTNAPAVSTNK